MEHDENKSNVSEKGVQDVSAAIAPSSVSARTRSYSVLRRSQRKKLDYHHSDTDRTREVLSSSVRSPLREISANSQVEGRLSSRQALSDTRENENEHSSEERSSTYTEDSSYAVISAKVLMGYNQKSICNPC